MSKEIFIINCSLLCSTSKELFKIKAQYLVYWQKWHKRHNWYTCRALKLKELQYLIRSTWELRLSSSKSLMIQSFNTWKTVHVLHLTLWIPYQRDKSLFVLKILSSPQKMQHPSSQVWNKNILEEVKCSPLVLVRISTHWNNFQK